MVDSSSECLRSDPRRQAVSSLKGYVYQIWHSVYRWITLGKDDVLYLEGAEDLDVLGPEKAEAIQVKNTKRSGSVTLSFPNMRKPMTSWSSRAPQAWGNRPLPR